MNNWKTPILLAVMVTVAGFTYLKNSHINKPSDLRDAVADNAIDTLKAGAGDSAINVPEPKAVHDASRGGADLSRLFPGLNKAAALGLSRLPGDTPYEKIKALFEKGVPATREDLSGWKSGRMFRLDGTIDGALLVGRVSPELPKGGPLFGAHEFGVHLETNYSTKFDSMNRFDREEVEAGLYRGWDMNFPSATSTLNDGAMDITIEERKADGYIVEKYAPAKGVAIYSYYFKDVTPKQ